MYSQKKCIGCGRCAAACPNNCHVFDNGAHVFDRTNCDICGKCAEACPTEALEVAGYEKSISEIINEVLKDKVFYENSGGGMPLSGGEPMHQFEFTYELLAAAKEQGLHICMETCGFAKEDALKKAAEYVDIFLFDYKETNPEKHKEFTGVSNELILKNLKMLDDMGAKIILRCPIIPSLNDRDEHFDGIADVANSLANIIEINIEPYHPLGKGKAEMLDKEYALGDLSFPEEETVAKWMEYIAKRTDVPVKKA